MQTPESPYVIRDRQVTDTPWYCLNSEQLDEFSPATGQQYLLPMAEWLSRAPDFNGFVEPPGLWLDGSDDPALLGQQAAQAPLIAIKFGSFMDGSGFSAASTLIETYRYPGELRAFGAILPDQAGYLIRCGFSSLAFADQDDARLALTLLENTAIPADSSYQGSVDQPRTPFARRVKG